MVNCVKNMCCNFSEDLVAPTKTLAGNHSFQVNEDTPKLDEEKAKEFHSTVARGLFASKRARPDIQPGIAFLSTRVKQPDHDDWKKLA